MLGPNDPFPREGSRRDHRGPLDFSLLSDRGLSWSGSQLPIRLQAQRRGKGIDEDAASEATHTMA